MSKEEILNLKTLGRKRAFTLDGSTMIWVSYNDALDAMIEYASQLKSQPPVSEEDIRNEILVLSQICKQWDNGEVSAALIQEAKELLHSYKPNNL